MKILIEREKLTEKRREKGEGRERDRNRAEEEKSESEGRKRENLTYGSSADPTTFRVLLISREKEAERAESIDIRVVCVSNVSKNYTMGSSKVTSQTILSQTR